ncbi:hypothetical protein JCM19239_1123 [Vibrio variabilis]|uniref:Mannuronate-specific alginate lyase n=1 Tax=Vibrio variabilis TaxID=990271 RepID=A0ABQ0JEB6_9VIBR|nr:hypothetical protein JCM19239_1123 [Vibrio variabilis]
MVRFLALLCSQIFYWAPVSAFSGELECPTSQDDSNQQYENSVNFPNLTDWGKHFSYAHSATLVPDPHNEEHTVLRVEVQENDVFATRTGDAYRAEVYERYKAPFNTETRYRFKTLISEEWEFDDVRALIAQWHATPDLHLGEISRSPNLGIEVRNNRFLIRGQTSDLPVNLHNKEGMTRVHHYLSEPIEKNRWYQFDIKVMWTPSSEGYLQVQIDDATVVDYHGPTSYLDCVGPYFKAGVYRDYSSHTFVCLF